MKQAKKEPASAPEHGRDTTQHDDAANAPLPHEADQNVESQHEHAARDVGKQAHEDVERGLVDTDEPLRGHAPERREHPDGRSRKA
ncbi:hypothetical protein [Caballeronia insecticola]|uniref:Uncharacterized protein n=1 Tax=Caballeronia insecticola TaxID=758793 RepID=R4WWI2_9BURK|nr:hypothetical protein [Caballeronia insecticola]BAN23306.1 putative uncharacterized protein [Caballeronia insecticola]